MMSYPVPAHTQGNHSEIHRVPRADIMHIQPISSPPDQHTGLQLHSQEPLHCEPGPPCAPSAPDHG